MKLDFYGQIFEKYSNIKFRQIPFGGSRDVSMRMDRPKDGRRDITKVIVAFRNFFFCERS